MTTHAVEPKSPRRRRLRISIGVLCLVIAGLAVWLAGVANEARRQRRAIETIKRLGGDYSFDYEFVGGNLEDPANHIRDAKPPGPAWLRRWVGDEPFQDVVDARLYGNRWRDDDLAVLEDLPRLRVVTLWGDKFTDAGLAHLRGMRCLQSLGVVSQTIGDAGMAHLRDLKTLENASFDCGQITDAGVENLLELRNLRRIDLKASQLTDVGLVKLGALPKLAQVHVEFTKTSDSGIIELKKVRPGVWIDIDPTNPPW